MKLNENYILFLDDERTIEMVDRSRWPNTHILIARSSDEAKKLIYNPEIGVPLFCSFDHDLGGEDTTMVFLRWFVREYCDLFPKTKPFEYAVHSANPVGAKNIVSFMESWRKSLEL